MSVPWQEHKVQIPNTRRHYSQMKLSERIPPNSWDSHMHVVDPATYPLAADAQYAPTPHTLAHATSFYSSIGITNMVFVQPSIYANDNSCMLDALRAIGPRRARAVVSFDPLTTPSHTLREWHAIGVRGVRLNLQSTGKEMGAQDPLRRAAAIRECHPAPALGAPALRAPEDGGESGERSCRIWACVFAWTISDIRRCRIRRRRSCIRRVGIRIRCRGLGRWSIC